MSTLVKTFIVLFIIIFTGFVFVRYKYIPYESEWPTVKERKPASFLKIDDKILLNRLATEPFIPQIWDIPESEKWKWELFNPLDKSKFINN